MWIAMQQYMGPRVRRVYNMQPEISITQAEKCYIFFRYEFSPGRFCFFPQREGKSAAICASHLESSLVFDSLGEPLCLTNSACA
jgi:hypothetical protein